MGGSGGLQVSQDILNDEMRYTRNVALMRDIRNYEIIFGEDYISARYSSESSVT